jgi:L-aminopeptidase/D-esterase-like protein
MAGAPQPAAAGQGEAAVGLPSGVRVGHFTDARRPTGCTVLLCPEGAVCGVDVRGGAPGTRDTDLLRPENTVEQVHAVLLTGGSAFGLDAAGGVMRWLEARGFGLPVGPARVPIVPTAVLFDLWVGDASIRPDAQAGWAACEAAWGADPSSAMAEGNVGAGAGASVGKLFGPARAMKGGLGIASVRLRSAGGAGGADTAGGVTVAAVVAVNAVGDVLDEQGRVLAGARTPDGHGLVGVTQALLDGRGPPRLVPGASTTIGAVITNARLTKAQAHKLASLAHHGLSRAIDPITTHDGDTLFALATGEAGEAGEVADLSGLGAAAAHVVAAAIRRGVRAAEGLTGLPAVKNLAAGLAPNRTAST